MILHVVQSYVLTHGLLFPYHHSPPGQSPWRGFSTAIGWWHGMSGGQHEGQRPLFAVKRGHAPRSMPSSTFGWDVDRQLVACT